MATKLQSLKALELPGVDDDDLEFDLYLLCKIECRCLLWPHKILVKTIGEMSVNILGV